MNTSPEPVGDAATGEAAGKGGVLSSRWLRGGVSALLLVALLYMMDPGRAGEIVRAARPDLLLLVCLLFVLQRLFAAYRWYILLHGKNPEASFWRVVRLILISDFLGFFGPGGVGYEVVKVYGMSRTTSDVGLSVTSVLVERFMALLALILLVLLGLAVRPVGLPPAIGQLAWLGLALMALGVVVLMHPRLRFVTEAMLSPGWLSPLRRTMARVYECLDAYRGQPGLMAWAAALALGFQLLRVVTAIAAAWAIGADVEVLHFVVIMPVIIFVTLLPISIGGIGVREAGFVYLFGLVGMTQEAAFAVSIIISGLALVSALPGALMMAAGRPVRA